MSTAPILERPTPTPGATPALLRVKDLETRFFTRKRGTVHAVNGVTFNLRKGERMAIVGESGSGKSVMTMSLMRLIGHPGRITGGAVTLDDTEVLGLSEKELNDVRGKRMAMVFQDPMTSLNGVLRIGDQLMAPMTRHLRMTKAEARARAIELLGQVGIPAPELRVDAYPHELSGGMRQRVLIAMALSCKPEVILADEPTTALDVTIQAQIITLLRKLAEETGVAVILVTHDLGLVARFAQTVAVMYAGRIVEMGPVREIYANPQHPYTQGLLASIPTTVGPRVERLSQIPGSPPDMSQIPPGCAFAPRCPMVARPCTQAAPPLLRRGPSHTAACWVTSSEPVPGVDDE